MTSQFFLCDVFADLPFGGNQLAVFPNAEDLSSDTMAAVAKEFGWSEVVFVVQRAGAVPLLRIWSPAGELPFAGHPTVGAAVVLAYLDAVPLGHSELELAIGRVHIEVNEATADGGEAGMTQRVPTFGRSYDERARLAEALSLSVADLVPELDARPVSTGSRHFMVPVRSLDALSRARADLHLLPSILEEVGARWAYLFTVSTPQSSSAARARALQVGREDAATGSAAGCLGAYMVEYGLHRAGRFDIEQGVEMGRPSRISVDVQSTGKTISTVSVSGRVRIWARGSAQVSA